MGNEKRKEVGLSLKAVMRNAWIGLLIMFLADKVLHLVDPPLPEYWYGIFVSIAVSGKIIDITRKG